MTWIADQIFLLQLFTFWMIFWREARSSDPFPCAVVSNIVCSTNFSMTKTFQVFTLAGWQAPPARTASGQPFPFLLTCLCTLVGQWPPRGGFSQHFYWFWEIGPQKVTDLKGRPGGQVLAQCVHFARTGRGRWRKPENEERSLFWSKLCYRGVLQKNLVFFLSWPLHCCIIVNGQKL